jgi:hypothetical protein
MRITDSTLRHLEAAGKPGQARREPEFASLLQEVAAAIGTEELTSGHRLRAAANLLHHMEIRERESQRGQFETTSAHRTIRFCLRTC